MKKNDTLTKKTLTPKKEIINFLLSYSKTVQPVKTKSGRIILVSKN